MNPDLKLKDRLTAKVNESILINAFRVFATWFYRSLSNGFLGTVFSSFSRKEEAFKRSLSGFATRRVRGKETFYKKIRRKVAGGFENSFLLNKFSTGADYMLGFNLRMYGAFSVIFGIYTMLMFTIKVYAMGVETDFIQLIVGGMTVILSIPMLYSKKSLAASIYESRIARYLLIDALKIPESKFSPKTSEQHSNTRYNAAVISGMIIGFLTYFISPLYIINALVITVICWVILYQPEAGIIGLIIIAPFVSFFTHPSLVLAAGVVITTVSYLIKYLRGKRTMRFGLTGAFIALFVIDMLFGGIVTAGGSGSFYSALMYAVLVLGYFLTINLIRTRENCRHAMAALAISLSIASLYGVAQYIFGDVTANWLDNEMFSYIAGRATSFFDNPNVLGSYIILMLPMLLVLMINTHGFKKKFILIFSVLISVLCLVWTWSRGAWLGFIIGITIFFLIFSYKTLVVLFGIGLTVPLLGYVVPQNVIGRFMSIGNTADSSTYYRVFTWKGVLRMLREVWLGGIGVGETAFEQLYPMFAYAGTEASPHAHNLIMQIISETGNSGIVIFAIVILLFVQNGFEFIKHSSGEDKLIVAAGVCGILSILVMGMFDFIWYNYRVFFLFWVVIALMTSFITASRNENETVYDRISTDSADISLYSGN